MDHKIHPVPDLKPTIYENTDLFDLLFGEDADLVSNGDIIENTTLDGIKNQVISVLLDGYHFVTIDNISPDEENVLVAEFHENTGETISKFFNEYKNKELKIREIIYNVSGHIIRNTMRGSFVVKDVREKIRRSDFSKYSTIAVTFVKEN